MNLKTLLVSLLFTGSAFAQITPDIWPMPSPLPVIPKGTNSAIYPAPRTEWFVRVINNNARARPIAGSIQLVFDGDSITDLWQKNGKAVWDEHYGKLNAFDFGLGGDLTQSVLWRLAQGQMDGVQPKLIALMIGTNNLSSNTAEEIADGVKAIVADYQKRCPESTILLQAVFPRGEQPTNPLRAKIKAINEIISKLGDDKKIIYIDFGDKFLNADGTISREIMGDFLHPTEKGYQIWADAIQPIIDRYFPAK